MPEIENKKLESELLIKLLDRLELYIKLFGEEISKLPITETSGGIGKLFSLIKFRPYILSNIDDLVWFYKNGLGDCARVIDFGTGGGYIAYLLSSFVDKVVGYEYIL